MTPTGFCYRTQVAMRAMVTSPKRMQEFLADEYDGQKEARKMDMKCREVCQALRTEIEDAVEVTGRGGGPSIEVVNVRWKQLLAMLELAEEAGF